MSERERERESMRESERERERARDIEREREGYDEIKRFGERKEIYRDMMLEEGERRRGRK